VTLRQRIRFYKQIAVLVRAGLPIRASFTRLREKIPGGEVATISDKLDAGERLGEAFAVAGFTPFETHLVAAGERSARIENIFEHLADFWSRELEMRQALIRPLYYPIVVLHLAVALGSGVQLFTTPWPEVLTKYVITMVLLYVFGLGVFFVARAAWSSESMRRFWLFLPIIGSALKTASAYRWISALRLEFSAGISLYRAVGDAWHASGYINSERFAAEAEQSMLAGVQLSTLVHQWKQLPRDWSDFIETGEISGAFETAFKNLEEEAARAWTLAQQRMTEWVPKIVYFFVLLIVAAQVMNVMYQVEIKPIIDTEKLIP
jgi:type II secretory pathway component PulF